MTFETILVGGTTNCYIVYNENKKGFLVDPGAEADKILAEVSRLEVTIEAILLTHAHGDHIAALNQVRDALAVDVYMHKDELENYRSQPPQFVAMLGGELPDRDPDILLDDGDCVTLSCGSIQAIHTPGHTPGSVCYRTENLLFSGDTLFRGSIGRTDFPGGDIGAMMASLRKLADYDESLRVLSGHGPETSIGIEKRSNPFILQLL